MALAMDILWAWQSPQKKSGSRGRHWGSGVGTKHPLACGIGRAGRQFPSGLLYTSGLGFTSGLLLQAVTNLCPLPTHLAATRARMWGGCGQPKY